MAIGATIRRVLPAHLERRAADAYRRIFVDLDKVAAHLATSLPASARLLDIGGGDGDLLNRLLALRDDIDVDMVDIAPRVGVLLDSRYESRIRRFPSTPLMQHAATHGRVYEAALLSDVMHHVPSAHRPDLLRAMATCLLPDGAAFIKDVEPGHPRARLGWWCDRYVSGDRDVALISMADLRSLVEQTLDMAGFEEIGLLAVDRPNYLVRIASPEAR